MAALSSINSRRYADFVAISCSD